MMRVRALSLIVTISILLPSAAGASQVDESLELPFIATIDAATTVQSVEPVALEPTPMRIPDPDPNVPASRWFGCNPPVGGVCVDDPFAPVTPESLVPEVVESVDDWRPLVEVYFKTGDVDRAMRVIRCESGGDHLAKNPGSSASGLFQHLGSLWAARTVKSGYDGAEIFDPVANVAVAAWLVYEGGGWGHWNPSRHCWR